ncbi:hypothetical protein [Paenibacillus polymyxa]|uniref:hypothetical protein n=1 Tax=Paenibacillus polymyxa TaxID=1406 RepID=UPI00287FD76F|nr:hypothetical protein [Paenibacillus polymyxa]
MAFVINLHKLSNLYFGEEITFSWTGVNVTIEEIRKAIKDPELKETEEPFLDDYLNPFNPTIKSKEWHLGRIKYLANYPEKTTPIEIQNRCEGYMQFPIPVITDGHHRILANLGRGDKYIEVEYYGMASLLDYLTDKTEDVPWEPHDFR